jgi:hypothetical protein
MQYSSMAMTFMGKLAHPETGKAAVDLEPAKMFIDMLEMLQAKTKGNLTKEEASLLKQTLMSLQLTFVETVDTQSKTGTPAQAAPPAGGATPPPETSPAPVTPASETPTPVAAEEESRKKFTKKY